MFWQSNKSTVIILLLGLSVSFVAYFLLGSGSGGNIDLAKKVLSTGICVSLFAAALFSFLQARNTPGLAIVDELTEAHFAQMAALEQKYYPNDCITPAEEAYRWYRHYPGSTIAAAVGNEIVAFVNLFPVKEEIYQNLRAGIFNDHMLTAEGIIDPDKNNEEPLYMFLSCVLTEPEYRHLGLTRHLLSLAVEQYEPMAERCRGIITDNVTAEGAEFSRRYGFVQVQGSEHGSLIFEQDYSSFVEHVRRTREKSPAEPQP